METDPQHLLPAHVAFYRRRKFWGIVLKLQFSFNIFLFVIAGFEVNSLTSLLNLSAAATGSGAIYLIYATIINNPQNSALVSTIVYFPILLLLISKIINKQFKILYALILSSLMFISGITGILIALSLST